MNEPDDERFARAVAPLMEVLQNGVARRATPADVLELFGLGGPRYMFRAADGRYIAKGGKGWTDRQRDAIVLDDIKTARAMQREGRDDYGVAVRIVRLRRRGTCGLEGARLRPDLDVRIEDGSTVFNLSAEDAMQFLATINDAKTDGHAH